MIILSSNTYQGVVNTIEGYCNINSEIETFLTDELDQMGALTNGVEAYPVVYLTPDMFDVDYNINEYRFRIYIYDRLEKDRSNYTLIKDKTAKIATDLINFVRDDVLLPFEISSISNVYPFEDTLSTFVSGWFIDVAIDLANSTICDIPLVDNPLFINSVCSDAFLQGYRDGLEHGSGDAEWAVLEDMYVAQQKGLRMMDFSTMNQSEFRNSICKDAYTKGYLKGLQESKSAGVLIYWSEIEI